MSDIEQQAYGQESNERARDFHNQRHMFVIHYGDVLSVHNEQTRESHAEWFQREGWDAVEVIETCTRGYIMDAKIIGYIGKEHKRTQKVEDELLNVLKDFHMPTDTEVWVGVHMGEVGDVWPPDKYLGTVGELI